MKITQLMLSAGFGGAERYFVDLCHALQKRGHEVQAVCHRNFVAKKDLQQIENLQMVSLPVMGWWDLYHQAKIRAAIGHFRPDIVHAHLARAAYIGGRVCRSLQIPLIVKTHNYVKLKYYRNVDHFIVTTVKQKRYLLQQGIDESRISITPNFSLAKVADVIDTDNDELHFAAFGRMVKKKGMHVLLHAFRQFLDAGNKAVLHIGGDGPERKHLEALAETLGLAHEVQFHGWINDADSFITHSDVMVLPSLDEPFGIVVLEIMAKGRPLIATRTDGPMEILDKNSAYLVDPGDAEALSRILTEVAAGRSERIRRAQNAQALFTEHYSEEKVVPLIIDTYEQAVSGFKTTHPAAAGQ